MITLYMTKGLPASGKTTWAKQMIAEHPGAYKRVNKDDLRAMLDVGKWSRDNEDFVLHTSRAIIDSALGRGKHVIVDDTNFAPKHEAALRECAKKRGAAFVVQDFTDVPLETCIERDRKRSNYVGEAVIRKMHTEYLAKPVPQVEHDPALPLCIICDIDGTVALMNGRGPYEENKVDTDLPNRPIVDLVRQLAKDNIIVFVSGRHEAAREKTEKWLADNVLSGCALFMRPDGDDRKDAIIKAEIYEREFRGKWNVLFTLDDRNRVVDGWRALGLTCLQVAPGDF